MTTAESMRLDQEESSNQQQTTLPWIEKYRPETLSDVISQGHIVETIKKLIKNGKLPHLLFYGPPGTGKTSTILACAKEMYGTTGYKSMVLELNASDDRGIDVVREQIKSFASTRNIFSSGFKLIILDEADAMTNAAQSSLRRVIEKYTKNVRFCLICNYINGIIPAIQSRCTKFRFTPLKSESIKGKLEQICKEYENISISPESLDTLVKLSGGDMRKALNVLQSANATFPAGIDNPSKIYQVMGIPSAAEVQRIFNWLCNESFDEAFSNIKRTCEKHSYSISDIVKYLFDHLIGVQFKDQQRAYISIQLAEIEHALNKGSSEKAQLGALVGLFQVCRTM